MKDRQCKYLNTHKHYVEEWFDLQEKRQGEIIVYLDKYFFIALTRGHVKPIIAAIVYSVHSGSTR